MTASADPTQIRFEYEGAVRVSIAKDGDLIVSIEAGELREQAPVIFQNSGSRRDHVNGGYRLLGPRTVGFEIGTDDMTRPLVIDPLISYCTYLGGTGVGAVTSIAVDSSGNLYVAGWTEALNFPIAGAVQSLNRGGVDAFVVKLNPAGTQLLYATYIGGKATIARLALRSIRLVRCISQELLRPTISHWLHPFARRSAAGEMRSSSN